MLFMEFNVVSSELLKPSRNLQTPPKFSLTVFDRIMRYVPYQMRVLFYKPSHPVPFDQIVHLLKSSLAEVLSIFYPLAGRILVGDGITSPVLELDCSLGQSVKFTEAVTDVTFDQLGSFEPSDFNDSLCGMGSSRPTYPWSPDNPLFFVQVTRFGCGGISLGFGLSHQAADGVSAWHFINSWAEVARTGEVKSAPDITYTYKELQLTDEQIKRLESGEEPSVLNLNAQPPSPSVSKPKVGLKVYTLDRSMIERLRAEAASSTNGTRFSTFVLVSVYFWKKITLARQLPESTPCSVIVIVNNRGRSRLLSKYYFGNAAAGFFVTLNAGEIERSGIGELAGVLQKEIAAWNEEEIDKVFLLDWLQNNNSMLGLTEYTVQTTGSARHPVYETDFGFGKPGGVTVSNGVADGQIYLFPKPEGDGSVSVTIGLKVDDLERLIKQDN